MYDSSIGANVYDPSVDYLGQRGQLMPQMPTMQRSMVPQGYGGGQTMNSLISRLVSMYGQGQQQREPIAQMANVWSNARGITPENQWDAKWGLKSTSPLGEWSRLGEPQSVVDLNAKAKGPGISYSGAAGGGDLYYSGEGGTGYGASYMPADQFGDLYRAIERSSYGR